MKLIGSESPSSVRWKTEDRFEDAVLVRDAVERLRKDNAGLAFTEVSIAVEMEAWEAASRMGTIALRTAKGRGSEAGKVGRIALKSRSKIV